MTADRGRGCGNAERRSDDRDPAALRRRLAMRGPRIGMREGMARQP